jgi:DNA replication and repair protein RecF
MVPAVLFSATDVDLVFGPPATRRRFLDILLSQVDRQYLRSLQRYQRVLAQRNQLLKLLRDGHASDEETAFWDQELVKEGVFIMRRRREAIASIAVLARERLRSLTRGGEVLEVQYAPSTSYYEANEEQQAFDQALAANRDRERAIGLTLVGPHRDDVRFLVDEMDMGTYASRGQARSVALALRLAEAAHLADIKKEQPVVLLDDVLSELDASRRQQVMEAAQTYEQALITTTDLNMLEGSTLASASLFRVTVGSVAHSDMTFRRGPRG